MSSPRSSELTVLAMGGHSLMAPDRPPTVRNQFEVTRRAILPIADLIAQRVPLVLTHGNGPQVGFMQLRSILARRHVHEVPLDSLVADTQGAIGYMIQLPLRNELHRRGLDHPIATIVTEVEVDPGDPAMEHPEKPIGAYFNTREAREQIDGWGWTMKEFPGKGWRRLVPSPRPRKIVQIDLLARLVRLGVTAIAAGGGGIPVVLDDDGHTGIEAVIDKDRTSAMLATELGAGQLVITTAVDAVYTDFGTDHARPLEHVEADALRELTRQGHFPPGSMGPKVEAALQFIDDGGQRAVICQPDDLAAALEGEAGTTIVPT